MNRSYFFKQLTINWHRFCFKMDVKVILHNTITIDDHRCSFRFYTHHSGNYIIVEHFMKTATFNIIFYKQSQQ